MRIVDDEGRLLDTAKRAWDSGVVMDIGHGTGSFSFETAEAVMAAGRKPDVISTDLHQLSVNGPAFDLPTTLSKFMHLGMSLREAVEAATARPAAVLGLENEVGTLRPGSRADVALFRIYRGDFPLQDIAGNVRHAGQLLRNTATIVGGRLLERLPLDAGAPWTEEPDLAGGSAPVHGETAAAARARPHTGRNGRRRRRDGVKPRVLETSAFVFATDLAGEGVETVLDNLERRAGLGGVMPAFAYHAARDVFPHNPAHRVVLQERGALFFPPEPRLYDAGLGAAVRQPLALERDVLGETCRAAAARDLAVHAWTVFLHADRRRRVSLLFAAECIRRSLRGRSLPGEPRRTGLCQGPRRRCLPLRDRDDPCRIPPLPRPRARLSPRALPHLSRSGYSLPARALLLRALPRSGAGRGVDAARVHEAVRAELERALTEGDELGPADGPTREATRRDR